MPHSPGAGGALIKLDHETPFPLYWRYQGTALSTARANSARHFPSSANNPKAIAKEKKFLGEKKKASKSLCAFQTFHLYEGAVPFLQDEDDRMTPKCAGEAIQHHC